MSVTINSVTRTIDEISNEFPSLSRDVVIDVLEDCFCKLVRGEYGDYDNIFVSMDRKTGNFVAYRNLKVVDNADFNLVNEINLADAIINYPGVAVNDVVSEELPIDLYNNRKALDMMKRNIAAGIRLKNKELEYQMFKSREGEIITGNVKKVSPSGNIIVDLAGKYEGMICERDTIRGERYAINDSIVALISKVERSDDKIQINLSRSSSDFLVASLVNTVNEIEQGLVVIEGVAREAGSRAKIIVSATDKTIDPVGSCIGVKGARIKKVVEEIGGDKIDVIAYSSDINTLIQNAIRPVHPNKIEVQRDSANRLKITIVVDNESVSMVIGRRGQNARLLSKAIGNCEISIYSADDYKKSIDENLVKNIELITNGLDVDSTIAHLLVFAEYTSILSIAKSSIDQITKIPNFDAGLAEEIYNRAVQFISDENNYRNEILRSYSFVDPRMLEIEVVSLDTIYSMIENYNISSLEKLIAIEPRTLSEMLSIDLATVDNLIEDAKYLAEIEE